MPEKRLHPRVAVDVTVTCEAEGSQSYTAVGRDVSLGGMFLECSTLPAFGTQLKIRCRLPGAREDYTLPAVVRWTREGGFGVQFGLLGARETHALTELMRSERLER